DGFLDMRPLRTRQQERRRCPVHAHDHVQVLEAHLACSTTTTLARRCGLAHAPAHRQDVDLVCVLVVYALTRNAVDLEEVNHQDVASLISWNVITAVPSPPNSRWRCCTT